MTSQPDTLAPAGGLDLEIMAGVSAHLGRIEQELTYQRSRHESLCQNVTYINHIVAPTPNAAGIIEADDVLGPKLGQFWDVRRITAANFSGGSVAAFLNSSLAPQNQLLAFSSAGTYMLGKLQLVLAAGDQLVFNCASATGPATMVSIGVVQVSAPYWADYLI